MKKTYIAPETFVFTTLLNTNIMTSSIAINSGSDVEARDSQLVKEHNSPDIWGPKDWGNCWEIKE